MNEPSQRTLQLGHGRFDPISGALSLDGSATNLRPRTAALLAHLLRNAGRVVTKDELMLAVWPDVVVSDDSLVQCVKEIRQALGGGGRQWIRTIPRQGYAFVAETTTHPAPMPAVQPEVGQSRLPQAWRKALVLALLALLPVLATSLYFLRRADPPFAPPPMSIVVLPVINSTGDISYENLLDNLTEDLTTALSRMSGTTVIAPSTAFTFKGKAADVRTIGRELGTRYALEASLRREDFHLRLTVRLADTSMGVQLWTEKFDTDDHTLAGLREEVVTRVAARLGLRLIYAEAHRSQQQRPSDPDALDLLTRARALLRWRAKGGDEVTQARELLEHALRKDPGQAEAWVWLAKTYLADVRFGARREQDLQRARHSAQRALELMPDSAAAHGAKGWVLYNQGLMMQALTEFEHAVELNPNDVTLLASSGAAQIMLGNADAGILAIGKAIRLSPRDPELPLWQLYHGVADLHMGRDEAAVEWLRRSVQGQPKNAFGRLFLASAYALVGRTDEAQREMRTFQEYHPGFTLSRFRAVEPSDSTVFRLQRARVYEGLRRAGMPE